MRTRRLELSSLTLVASTLLFSPGLTAQDETAVSDAKTFKELKQKYDDATREWTKAYRSTYKTASKEEVAELMKTRPQAKTWLPQFMKIVEAAPKDDAAMQAASWIISNRAAAGTDLDRIVGVLKVHHLDNPKIGSLCTSLSRVPSQTVLGFLRRLEAKSPHDSVKAQACFGMAQWMKSQAGLVRMLKTADEARIDSLANFYGRQNIDVLKNADAKAFEKKAEALYVKICETPAYAEFKYGRGNLGTTAKTNLFEMRNLAIGKVAPEIAGEDIQGNPMKLTDYRGKVVVLDFWGDW